MTNEEKNTFAEMESAKNSEVLQQKAEPVKQSGEVDLTNFSDKAVGEKVKYNRPDLNGKEDVIDKFQIFMPDFTQEAQFTQSKNGEYWTADMTLYWTSKNADGAQNKESVSGAKVWKNRDGTPSDEINFWYEGGADNANQSCILWEKVAECLGIKPDELSPRQFVAFLNSKPKFIIAAQKTKNFKAKPGSPTHINKNMPGQYLKA